MTRAIQLAGLQPGDIDHVNAHATGTTVGDVAEGKAINNALGGHRPAVYAPKSALGHSVGAVGAVESILTVLALRDGVVPPTLNLQQPRSRDRSRRGRRRTATRQLRVRNQQLVRIRRAQRRARLREVLRYCGTIIRRRQEVSMTIMAPETVRRVTRSARSAAAPAARSSTTAPSNCCTSATAPACSPPPAPSTVCAPSRSAPTAPSWVARWASTAAATSSTPTTPPSRSRARSSASGTPVARGWPRASRPCTRSVWSSRR